MQNIGRQSIMRLLQITMSRRRVITVRPHSRLGNIPPAAYAKFCAPGMQRDGALEQPGGSAPYEPSSGRFMPLHHRAG